MNSQLIRTRLIDAFGEKPVAFVQALRFVYRLLRRSNVDPEFKLLPLLLSKGEAALDIGANAANWTYWLHHNVGRNGVVYAFEAEPYYALATGLAIKLLRLKGVRLLPFGLSDVEEDVVLRVTDSNGVRLTGTSYIDRNTSGQTVGAQRVKVRRLDSLIGELPALLNTKLIKCDVEGYELFVFKGAVEVLRRARPFIILETGNYEIQGYTGEDIYNFFLEREYASFAMTGANTLAKTDAKMDHPMAVSVNRVLVPRERLSGLQGKIIFEN